MIDIAAQIAGGPQSIAQLDDLASKLTGMGAKAAVFDDALMRVGADLKAAGAASAAAASALADGRAEFDQLERAAISAAKAADKQALKGVVPPDVGQRAADAAAAVDAFAVKLAGLERAAADASAEEKRLAATQDSLKNVTGHVNKTFAQNAENVSKVRGALGAMGGPLGRLGQIALGPAQAFSQMSAAVGTSTAAAVVAIGVVVALAAAVAALGVAAVAGVGALLVYGVKTADVARSAALAREAFAAANPALAGLTGQFDDLTRATGLADADLQGIAKGLKDAKVSAAQMPAALRAAALAESALGKGGSADFVARIKAGQLSVSAFARDSERKFGGIVAKQMLGLTAQGATLKRNMTGLFGGLNIEPVLAGLSTLVGLFDKNTAAGRFMGAVFEGLLQPLIDKAGVAATVIEAFALGVAIGFVKMYVAAKPTIAALEDFFGFKDLSLADTCAAVTKAAEFLAPVLAVVVGVVGLVVAGFGTLVAAGTAVLAIPIALGVAFGTAMGALVKFATDVARTAAQIGNGIVSGVVSGIVGGASAVVSAATNMATSAITAAKRALGIASPSKVFGSIGANVVAGYADAVESGTPTVTSAVESLVEPPSSPTPVLSAGGKPSVAGAAVSFAGAIFNFGAGTDGKQAARDFVETLTLLLEGDAAAVAGAT